MRGQIKNFQIHSNESPTMMLPEDKHEHGMKDDRKQEISKFIFKLRPEEPKMIILRR